MNEFKPGEIVDITIKGARVLAVKITEEGFRFLGFTHGDINSQSQVCLSNSQVTVERKAPAEWPPQIGDLWRGYGGRLWFTRSDGYGNPTFLSGNNDPSRDVDSVNQDEGPLALVHREEATP